MTSDRMTSDLARQLAESAEDSADSAYIEFIRSLDRNQRERRAQGRTVALTDEQGRLAESHDYALRAAASWWRESARLET